MDVQHSEHSCGMSFVSGDGISHLSERHIWAPMGRADSRDVGRREIVWPG